MSAGKHTPGPWVQYANGAQVYADPTGRFITCVQSERPAADARLIASAPELLEALQMVRDYVVTMKGVGHQYQVQIDAAIARATGTEGATP